MTEATQRPWGYDPGKRRCDGCGLPLIPKEAETIGDQLLCVSCAAGAKGNPAMPQKLIQLPVNHPLRCTTAGCRGRRYKKTPAGGLCYRCVRTKHPELLPVSHRPKGAAPPRKAARRSPPPRKLKPPTPTTNGAPCCDFCRQPLPATLLKAADLLRAHGVEDRAVAIKAAALVLQVAR